MAFITFAVIGSLFYKFTSKKALKLGEKRQKIEIERTKKLQESFTGIKDIKTYLKTGLFIKRYDNLADNISYVYALRDFISKLPKVFLEILIVFVVIILTFFLISDNRENSEIIAILSVFGLTSIKALPYMSNLLSAINTLKFSEEALKYYDTNLKLNSKNININFNNQISEIKSFEFKNIDFKYFNKNNYLFKNFSCKFEYNTCTEVKGETGSGKSTLIDIILGLKKPQNYVLLINGVESKIPNDWLKNFSYVPQSIFLFDTTIKKNITMSDDDNVFDKNLFQKSLKIAEIDEFINKLPEKEDTLIGELGSNLSGGQKQRLGIARAIYKNSLILIFDEATNSLDLNTEKKIYKNISNNLKDKIFIFINHREMDYNIFNKKISLKVIK